MAFGQDKIKDFFEAETEKIAAKIEKTPIEKFSVFFLVLITISAVVLGYLQMKKNIEQPLMDSYLREKRGELTQQYVLSNTNTADAQNNAVKLQNQDSDFDGINDYDEIYLYRTNPYNQDTDGDGINDLQEITNGTNPLCAEGTVCQDTSSTTNANLNSSSNVNVNSSSVSANPLNINDATDLQAKLLSGEVTLEQLGINDPEMQKILDQLKSSQLTNTNQLNPTEKTQALESLKNMTPAQIREELIKQGVDPTVLQGVDDQTLLKIFNETIQVYQ